MFLKNINTLKKPHQNVENKERIEQSTISIFSNCKQKTPNEHI